MVKFVPYIKRVINTFWSILLPLYAAIIFVLFRGDYSLNFFSIIIYVAVLGIPTWSFFAGCKYYICEISVNNGKFYAQLFAYNDLVEEFCIPLNELRVVVQQVWWASGNVYELIIYRKQKELVVQRPYGEWNKKEFDKFKSMIKAMQSEQLTGKEVQ
jgi:hypothetical protein